ncbi:MAG: two-component sensor histidine kinase [Syntrophobacteraceae bacterium]|nr:two-component sensor histidine kinase [Syntrophobacteraceae bacterium]
MDRGKYYKSLNRNLVALMIIVSFTPLVLIMAIIGYRFETSYRFEVRAHLKELVQKHQQNVNGFLNERLATIRLLADTCSFDQLTHEPFVRKQLERVQNASGGGFVDLGLIDDQGLQVSYAGPYPLDHARYEDAEWFKMARERDYLISDVFLGLRGTPHFVVSVTQRANGRVWMLRGTVDFEDFNRLVANIRLGQTGKAFILNRKGELQTRAYSESPAEKEFFLRLISRYREGEAVSGDASTQRPGERSREGRAEGEGTMLLEVDSPSGTRSVYVLTPIKSGEWFLVYQQEAHDAFADLISTRNLAFFIFAIGAIAIFIKAVVLSRRMVGRIALADQEKDLMNERMLETGKLASLGELAAGIAHEINNPVAVMVEEAGWMEDLLDEEDLQFSPNVQEFRHSLEQIRMQGTRCREITHKLLSFARKTDPRSMNVQINEVIEDVIALSEQRARFSNVRIRRDLSGDIPTISISPSEMQQVLLNLINNALDAVDQKNGGEVRIITEMEDSAILISVADDGEGIPEENLSRIFHPFYTTKPVGKGTGLGLSICYGIVKKWGGSIEVSSTVGVGTAFHIRFPLSGAGTAEGGAHPAEATSPELEKKETAVYDPDQG